MHSKRFIVPVEIWTWMLAVHVAAAKASFASTQMEWMQETVAWLDSCGLGQVERWIHGVREK